MTRSIRMALSGALLPLLLTACLFGGGRDRTPPRRPPPVPARTLAPAQSTLPSSHETEQCLGRLSRADIEFRRLPDRRFDNGCSLVGTIQLLDIGTPVANLGAMRCGLAEKFAGWVRYAVQPAARRYLDADVAKVETFGTYACRGTVGNGTATRLSEHAVADAVDVSGFVLSDGRRITVLGGWRGEDADVRSFLRVLHESGCKRFQTVLGPDYNAAHRNHLHLDMGRGPFCR